MIVVVTDLARMERRVYRDVGTIVEQDGEETRLVLAWPNGDETELHPYRQRIEVIA